MRRILLVALAVLALGIGTGVAWARLSSTGSGTGLASTTSLTDISLVAASGSPSTPLLPGGTGDAVFAIDNPNPVSLTVVSVVANGTITVSGGSSCTTANDFVSFTNQTGLSIVVPAGDSDYAVDLTGSVSMSSSSASGCQGATFSIPVLVTAHRG